MFSTSYLNIIDSTTIYDNEAMSANDIYAEFTGTCKLLWFVPSSLANYIIANPSTYDFPIGAKLFELISAKLTIQNNSVIYNQISIAKWFMATLTFYKSTLYNLVTKDKGIRLSQATINITDSTFYNISVSDATSFVFAGIGAIAYMINSTYSNSSWPFMFSSVAKITFNNMIVKNWYPHVECISILKAPNVTIMNSQISYAYSDETIASFRILDSSVDLITNTTISYSNQYAIYFFVSKVAVIDGLNISNTYGMYTRSVNQIFF